MPGRRTEVSGGSIYTELADQYKVMDAASNVVKRNVLAQHLREVIDVLEQRVRCLFNLKHGGCSHMWSYSG
jgi:hypothetical protein